uniref:Uncharacterized protein n=1 Tax=Megaviridae environmental sample TaxID=1737588 RepID=A0A5J6VK10_9VIRU|nr:MAG: hypothetical protein [Megaviridae environmental sample]
MDNKKITKRLTRDKNYSRPRNTYQEKLSPKEIKKKLEEYRIVENIFDIEINTHVRYFTVNSNTGEKQFRLGGFLTKINKNDNYVILSNGKFSWSVQINDAIFFEKMSFSELKEELIQKISEKYKKDLDKLKVQNSNLKRTLKEIKNHIKK